MRYQVHADQSRNQVALEKIPYKHQQTEHLPIAAANAPAGKMKPEILGLSMPLLEVIGIHRDPEKMSSIIQWNH